jgi:hypothetical protein
MKLKVVRDGLKEDCTLGKLYVNDEFECFTLEDEVRLDGEKVFGKTAIPYGVYDVTITHSNHFGRDLPLLGAVPNFEGVRIHAGNSAADTEGCLLVGHERSDNSIARSRLAFDALFPKIRDAIDAGEEVTIEYV